MDIKKIINWHELSRYLSGSGQNIRPNRIPEKYKKQVETLLKKVNEWKESGNNT